MMTLVIAMAVLFSACQQKKESPILKEQFSVKDLPQLIEKIRNDKDLTREEIEILNAGITGNMNRLDSIEGKTLKNIIETRQKILKKNSINKFVNTALALNVASRYIGWVPDTTNTTGIVGYKIYVKNKSSKEIKRIFGRLNFFTNQKRIVGLFDVNLTVNIPSEKESVILAKISQNNMKNVAQIRNILETAPNTLFAQWQVLEVEFTDGDVISLMNKKTKTAETKE
jgi:hypothetical protein